MPLSEFDIDACLAALNAGVQGHWPTIHMVAMAECNSTNSQLMLLAEDNAATGTIVVSDRQTAGRGRRNRPWISAPHDSLTFSVLWRFPADSPAPVALSLAVGLALQRALATSGALVSVKWPNDILCQGRKLAGVLIETQPGDIKSAVIGIGINLRLPANLPKDVAANAIALDEAMPLVPGRESLLATLLQQLRTTLTQYGNEGFASLREEWQGRHAHENCEVKISGGSENLHGTCFGVTDNGELLLKTADGVRRIISGDVSLRTA